jgi:GNAT superfamily N-acetyltransferase
MTTQTTARLPHATGALDVRSVHLSDPLVKPLLEDLVHEYSTRYHDALSEADLLQEMEEYPPEQFATPDGDLVLVLSGGVPVAGGAFRLRAEPELGDLARSSRPASARRPDGTPAVRTAELKRIWTHNAHRRRGLAKVVLAELETRAVARGYERIYLTTGPRQPEAAGLYFTTGYTPLFDVSAPPGTFGPLPFEKWLCRP